ncbi:hypothetical protein [Acetobacter orientalis]|uniref:hypothetical protein n=1 Tax=Acetobacter orientalis TaxID=146474 RepID=UPI0039EB07CB
MNVAPLRRILIGYTSDENPVYAKILNAENGFSIYSIEKEGFPEHKKSDGKIFNTQIEAENFCKENYLK